MSSIPTATKTRIKNLEKELDDLQDARELLRVGNRKLIEARDQLKRQNSDLQAANNRLLERARAAEELADRRLHALRTAVELSTQLHIELGISDSK